MQITITLEVDTLDEAVVKLQTAILASSLVSAREMLAALAAEDGDNFTDQGPLHPYQAQPMPEPTDQMAQADAYLADFKLPEPTDQELTDALTLVLTTRGKPAAMQLLADFDTTSIKRIPEGRAREFLVAAEKVIAS